MNNNEKPVRNVLLFCSGAGRQLMDKCPESEHIKYSAIGFTVLSTGLLASIYGGYAFYTVFRNYPVAILFGLLWGSIIFNIDRFIVSTFRKTGTFKVDIRQAIPRIILASLIAICIARPLELHLFSKEINGLLIKEYTAAKKIEETNLEHRVNTAQKRITGQLEKAGAALNAANTYKVTRDKAAEEYHKECDGTGGTLIRGDASECKRKRKYYEQVNAEYISFYQGIDKINLLTDDLTEKYKINNELWQKERDRNIQALNDKIDALKGAGGMASFLEKHKALSELSERDRNIMIMNYFIFLLFVFIEIVPVTFKLLTPKGAYDHYLNLEYLNAKQEFENGTVKAAEQAWQVLKRRLELEEENRITAEASEYSSDKRLEIARTFIDKRSEIERAFMLSKTENWHKDVLQKTNVEKTLQEDFQLFINSFLKQPRSESEG
jgi:hypothetical protein